MDRSRLSTSAGKQKRFRIQGTQTGSSAFNRIDQGYPAASQTSCRIEITRGPYRSRDRLRRRSGSFPGGGPFSLRIAYLRLYPQTRQNSSRIGATIGLRVTFSTARYGDCR
jgi:hypothetical protein